MISRRWLLVAIAVVAVDCPVARAQETRETGLFSVFSGDLPPVVTEADFLSSDDSAQPDQSTSADARPVADPPAVQAATNKTRPTFAEAARQTKNTLGSRLPDNVDLSSLLWKLTAVLAFALMACVFVAMKFFPGPRKVGSSDSGGLSLEASLALPNKTLLSLVSAAGHTLVVASDSGGVQSVTRLPEPFGDQLNHLAEAEEGSDA